MSAAPDSTTRRLVDDAMNRRGDYDFAGARQLLDKAITRAPAYAEAFNQRGFIRFLQDDFDGALEDVDRAIELEPRHFAAMAGRAHILMRQGRFRLAQAQLREAVNIHPFLKERTMLVPPVGTTPAKPAGDGFDL
ncbi:MAG TPA: tetratricopeptide repeat protein [Aurantimonas sp.]